MAVEWSRITPPCPVREVETQRKKVIELRNQVTQRRGERDAAAARVVELEREDRQRMAKLMASGKRASSAVEEVERARHDAAGAVRATEALDLAITDAEQQLHEVIGEHRGAWAGAVASEVVESRTRAQEALAAFREVFLRYHDARIVAEWLSADHGLDRERAARLGTLGHAPGSERITGNHAPADLGTVFDWLAAAVEPPKPKPQTPVQPLTPVSSPGAYFAP